MIRRLPSLDLFHIGPTGLEDISDSTLNSRLDALDRAALANLAADPAGTLPDCPLSQLSPLEAV